MKRFLIIALAILLAGILDLSGCSSSSSVTTTPAMTNAAPTSYSPPSTYNPVPTYSQPPTYPTTTYVPKPTTTTVAPTTTVPRPTLAPPTATTPGMTYPSTTTAPQPTGTIGLSTGGAKDIGNFRENILNDYLPLPTDVTYEGLFYDYYFDTGASEPTNKLFAPSYSFAVTRDPFSQQTEYYLSVGLNSGMKESDFQRKKLNLVLVLDDSGSMGEAFNQYYYDGTGRQVDAYAGEGINRLRKIDSAKEAITSILDQLNPDDQFSIVLFNSNASIAKPMGPVSRTNMQDVRNRVMDINAGGSTNLADGYDLATQQFRNLREVSSYDYENRIIVLTDAQPNTGDYSASGIMDRVNANAQGRIYSTIIGIGVDFNTQLVDAITKTKGANYYTVHSPSEFRERMNNEFDYMVTPLVFNLNMRFESNGWRIEKVFGSPEANQATGDLMRINTLFPSKSVGGQTKGGLVLLKLRKISNLPNQPVYLRVSYEDRNGRTDGSSQTITLENTRPEYFENTGIRKGVLLVRYASLLQNWLMDERQHLQYSSGWNPSIDDNTGIVIPTLTSQWERLSVPLRVSPPYKRLMANFASYFVGEMNAIQDYSLDQELAVLQTLAR
jgi:Ca-activated chloride channel family protein